MIWYNLLSVIILESYYFIKKSEIHETVEHMADSKLKKFDLIK